MDHDIVQPFLNYLGVSLWISSTELMPESITQFVGLQPTYTHLRGSLIPGRNVRRRPEFDVHEWQLRRQLDAKPGANLGQHTEKFITDFLNEIEAHTSQIKKLSEHHNVTVALVYHVDEIPYIGLNRDQVQAIAALGAKLDYDLMVEESGFDETDESDPVEGKRAGMREV
jgi:hypothetical protein